MRKITTFPCIINIRKNSRNHSCYPFDYKQSNQEPGKVISNLGIIYIVDRICHMTYYLYFIWPKTYLIAKMILPFCRDHTGDKTQSSKHKLILKILAPSSHDATRIRCRPRAYIQFEKHGALK